MLKKTAQAFGYVALFFATLIAAFLIVFPYFAHPGPGDNLRESRRLFKAAANRYRDNVETKWRTAMQEGNTGEVIRIWNTSKLWSQPIWQPHHHLAYARYLVKKGRFPEARKALEYLIDPPPGAETELSTQPEVFELWLTAAKGAPEEQRLAIVRKWNAATDSAPLIRRLTNADIRPLGVQVKGN